MSSLFTVRTGFRFAEVLVAATIILVLGHLHGAIVRNALTMVGARADAPLLMLLLDNCGGAKPIPAAWRVEPGGKVETLSACKEPVKILASTAPEAQLALLVNGSLVEPLSNPQVAFYDSVQLREGVNELELVDPKRSNMSWQLEQMGRPQMRSADFGSPRSRSLSSLSDLMNVPEPPAPISAEIYYAATGGTPTVHSYRFERGAWNVAWGRPGERLQEHPSMVLGRDGFALEPNLDSNAEASPIWKIPVTRELRIEHHADGSVALQLDACLPAEHGFVDWARNGQISGPELVERLTGARLLERSDLSVMLGKSQPPVRIDQAPAPEGCFKLKTEFLAEKASVILSGSFPMFPGDRLTLAGFPRQLRIMSERPDTQGEDEMIWRGSRQGPDRLRYLTLFALDDPDDRDALSAARAEIRPASGGFDAEKEQAGDPGLFPSLVALGNLVPRLVYSVLVAALPIGLMFWALGRHRRESPDHGRIDRARAGLLALFALMAAIALQPLLVAITYEALTSFNLVAYAGNAMKPDVYRRVLYAPIACLVVVMIVPLIFAYERNERERGRLLSRLVAAAISILLVVFAVAILYVQRWAVLDPTVVADLSNEIVGEAPPLEIAGRLLAPGVLAATVLVWCLVGLLLFWVPIYWLAQAALRRGRLLGASFLAAMVIFFMPLMATGAGLVQLGEFVRILYGWGTSPFWPVVASAASIVSAAIVIVVVMLVLRSYREILALMATPAHAQRLRQRAGALPLFVVALFVVLPAAGALAAGADGANLGIVRYISTFQAFGAAVALLAPLAAVQAVDAAGIHGTREQRFALPPSLWLVISVAFASYLTLWADDPLTLVLLAAVGWPIFHYLVLAPEPAPDPVVAAGAAAAAPAPTPTPSAKAILASRAETQLIEARRTTVEKQFSELTITPEELDRQRQILDRMTTSVQRRLGMPLQQATRRLLCQGPGASPYDNGWLGARWGLLVAVLFQVVLLLDLRSLPGTQGGLIRAFVVNPSYNLVAIDGKITPLLDFLEAGVNALVLWVVVGFLFGLTFHRVRGSDGFIKAITFGAGLAAIYTLRLVLDAKTGGVPLESFGRLLPILLFLLVLGSCVFDGRTLARQGVGLSELPAVYGLRTSVGYVSFATALAGAQPLLQFLTWIGKALGVS